jgi:hypothetical protein
MSLCSSLWCGIFHMKPKPSDFKHTKQAVKHNNKDFF